MNEIDYIKKNTFVKHVNTLLKNCYPYSVISVITYNYYYFLIYFLNPYKYSF